MAHAAEAQDKSGSRLKVTVLGFLVANRPLAMGLIVVFALNALFGALRFPIWRCPFRLVTGLDCPGCGMTRGMIQLAAGHWHKAISLHPFSPFFLLGFVLLVISWLLPEPSRIWLAEYLSKIEARTGLAVIFSLLFAAFGLARICVQIMEQ
jgi:hypothetical protein